MHQDDTRLAPPRSTGADAAPAGGQHVSVTVDATGPTQVRVETNYVSKQIGAYHQRLARSGMLGRLRPPSSKAVLDVLLDLLHAEKSAMILLREDRMVVWPVWETIERRSSYGTSAVHVGLKRLVGLGLLRRERGTGGRSTKYEILWPPGEDSEDYWKRGGRADCAKAQSHTAQKRSLILRKSADSYCAKAQSNEKIKESSDTSETAAERKADPAAAAVVLSEDQEKAKAELAKLGVDGLDDRRDKPGLITDLGAWFTFKNVRSVTQAAARRALKGKIDSPKGWAVSECRRRATVEPSLFDTAAGREQLREIARKTAADRGEYAEKLPLSVHRYGDDDPPRAVDVGAAASPVDDYAIPEIRPRASRGLDTIGGVLAAAEPAPTETPVDQAKRQRREQRESRIARHDAERSEEEKETAARRSRLAALPPRALDALKLAALARIDEPLRPFVQLPGFDASAGWQDQAIKLLDEGWQPPASETGGGT
jgi:hypothetical protein